MIFNKKLANLLITGTLLVGLPGAAFSKSEEKVADLVVLGDSLAAGWTPYGQKGEGYGEYLKERFEQSQYTGELDNHGVPGYVSSQLLNDVLTKDAVRQSIREAEVIALDIGANDLLRALRTNDQSKVVSAIVQVQNNLLATLTAIDQLNPDADVYVMGYYNPFPYSPQEQQASLMPILGALNQSIEAAAKVNGATFVPTAKVIAKQYEAYLPNPSDIHLSQEGYQTIAKEFWKAIDENLE